jgi:hypothetical protein
MARFVAKRHTRSVERIDIDDIDDDDDDDNDDNDDDAVVGIGRQLHEVQFVRSRLVLHRPTLDSEQESPTLTFALAHTATLRPLEVGVASPRLDRRDC